MHAQSHKHRIPRPLVSEYPSYFGGYLLDNYMAVADALALSRLDLVTLVCNSIEGSFLYRTAKTAHLARIDQIVAKAG